MKTGVVVFKSGGNFNYSVSIDGLDSLMRFLKDSDPQMRKALQKGLKDAAQPVLARARANAQRIADDGTYANSLSIRSRENGGIVLRSNDVAAGVKEFARMGATYRPKPSDKRRNARKMRSFPVGVPKRANQPRAMVPAVNDSVEEVKARINAKLEEVLRRADG
ncbi:MAG: HK97 gp10 family phage protein [Berryella intestinalis]|uniref:HK97 gp10 family phage protein n=1 Tax=Berryella intestinalis TaxID=1531429 RepID=UPI002A597883|nr:HK97 gp10 family phage protein [Berryella intestinalis]MDD7369267.1 HK97 gp10 family phage protein [Berryella intestinalis]MDY3129288.1 HK97 gp10 family phage protein [Berryella intestinalis]